MAKMDVMRVHVAGKDFDIRGDASDEEVKRLLCAGLRAGDEVEALQVQHDDKRFYIQPSAQHLWMLASLGAKIDVAKPFWNTACIRLVCGCAAACAVSCRRQLARLLRRCVIDAHNAQCHMLWFEYSVNDADRAGLYVSEQCASIETDGAAECAAVVNFAEKIQDQNTQSVFISGAGVTSAFALFGAYHPLTLAVVAFAAGVTRLPSCSY